MSWTMTAEAVEMAEYLSGRRMGKSFVEDMMRAHIEEQRSLHSNSGIPEFIVMDEYGSVLDWKGKPKVGMVALFEDEEFSESRVEVHRIALNLEKPAFGKHHDKYSRKKGPTETYRVLVEGRWSHNIDDQVEAVRIGSVMHGKIVTALRAQQVEDLKKTIPGYGAF